MAKNDIIDSLLDMGTLYSLGLSSFCPFQNAFRRVLVSGQCLAGSWSGLRAKFARSVCHQTTDYFVPIDLVQ